MEERIIIEKIEDTVDPISEQPAEIKQSVETKYISNTEKWSYIVGISFLANFLGMINSYRSDYLTNILLLNENSQKIINVVTTIVGYLIGFFVTYFVDNYRGKKGKFRPLALYSCIPFALFGFLMFYTPSGLLDSAGTANTTGAIVYICAVVIIFGVLSAFGQTSKNVQIVMTPNELERNSLFSSTSFFSSIMNSAPLVIILVLGFFKYKYSDTGEIISGYYTTNQMYEIALALCAVVYVVTMINAMLKTKERLPYLQKKNSMFEGIKDVLKNRNFWWLTFSNQVRAFRTIGTGFMIYVAGALLGDTSKNLILGLPTGIGTFVGMLIVKKLITKMDPIKVYWIFGIYSLLANAAAFLAGLMYLTLGGSFWQLLFIFLLFLIGIQFGSSNIIPNIFNADLLNELELETKGKRLEQTIGFTQGIFGTIITTIIGLLTPYILFTVCGYEAGEGVAQSLSTSIKLVFFYTLWAGIFFFISLFPMLGYKLDTKRRAQNAEALAKQRAEIEAQKIAVLTDD